MSITLIIIIVTVVISVAAWNNYGLMSGWIMNPYQVANRGQYYRLITSGFLHADWGHLFFNMLIMGFFKGFFGIAHTNLLTRKRVIIHDKKSINLLN